MNPKSNTLFHFTKSRETLKHILRSGFWPKYCLEDVGWLGYENTNYIAYPMVCFCDIPLSRIADHVGFYGEFGIGLTRQWAESNGLNPVLYVAGENSVTRSFRDLSSVALNLTDDEQQEKHLVVVRHLLAHTKPVQGTMVVDGKPVEKLFYQESEWRCVPTNNKLNTYLLKSKFDDEKARDEENANTKQHALIEFGPRDVKYIFVKTDADIPDIVNFIQDELDRFPSADLKVLLTRVVSLEGLNDDL